MSRAIRTILTTLVLVSPVIWFVSRQRRVIAQERRTEQRVSRNAAGETVLRLARDAQERIGLKTEALAPARRTPEITAYGRLQEDPSRSFVLRAPAAGTFRAAQRLDPGQVFSDGAQVGWIEPRYAPVDRLMLADRLSAARAEVASTSAALVASRAAYERARTLNADNKNLSDRAVEEAEARLKGDEARAAAAGRTVQLLEGALNRSAGSSPLAAERGGEAVEVLAQPGESVESGQAIVRLARFDQLIARVDVPAGQHVDTSVTTARILAVGHEDRPLEGERIGAAAAVDPATQGQPFLFHIRNPGLALRPGLSVTAFLKTGGASRAGAIVPRDALVRAEGKTWVYIQAGEDQFVRKEVAVDAGWFTTSLKPGDRVVVVGAQVLLSEESKSQIRVGEEGTGN